MGGIVSTIEGVASSFISTITGAESGTPIDFKQAIESMIRVSNAAANVVNGSGKKDAVWFALNKGREEGKEGFPTIMALDVSTRLAVLKKKKQQCESVQANLADNITDNGPGTTSGFPNTDSGLKEATKTLQQTIEAIAIQAIGDVYPIMANAPTRARGFGAGKFSPKVQQPDLPTADAAIKLALNGLPDDVVDFCINFVNTNYKGYVLGSDPQVNVAEYISGQFVFYISVVASATQPSGTSYSTAVLGLAVKTGFA